MIQKRLLTEKEPTLSGVMEKALSLEAAQKSAHTLHNAEAPQLLKVDRHWKITRKPSKTKKKRSHATAMVKRGTAPAVVVLEKPSVFIVGNWGMSGASARARKGNQEAIPTRANFVGR